LEYARILSLFSKNRRTESRIILDPLSATPSGGKTGGLRYKLYLPTEEELAAELMKERRMFDMEAQLSKKRIKA